MLYRWRNRLWTIDTRTWEAITQDGQRQLMDELAASASTVMAGYRPVGFGIWCLVGGH